MTRREFRSLSSPAAVCEAIESLPLDAGTEQVPVRKAVGRVLADRIDAPVDVPGFDRAAMDGYAVRAESTFGAAEHNPTTLTVVGEIHAGSEPTVEVGEGDAASVATGAVMPDGADAVIPVEQTRENGETVDLLDSVAPSENVMARGADIAAGDRTLGPGTRLGARHLGLLAATGTETVPVRKQPTVGVVSTGDELVQPGKTLDSSAGQIYDVNSYSLSGAIEAAGGQATVYATAGDELATLRETLQTAAAECDLLLTSGSTSAGETDLLYQLIEDEGEKLVHGVSLKPGRPMLVGRIFETAYIGLPGYPVSAQMVFRTFVAPAIRDAAGQPEPAEGAVDATLATRVRYDGGRLRLLPVGLVEDGGGNLVAYAPAKGSGATTTLGETDGVVRMAPERSLLAAGSTVTVERFDADDPIPSILAVGEPDPTVFGALDEIDDPRYLALGPQDAIRWLDDGIPDLLVTVGAETAGEDTPGEELARWTREWGFVVPEGNPDGVETVADIADLQFVNLSEALAVGRAFDQVLDETGVSPEEIDGYHRRLPGIESAARSVAAGRAAVGIGLRETADRLGLGFVGLDEQTVRVAVAPDRREKSSVELLESLLG